MVSAQGLDIDPIQLVVGPPFHLPAGPEFAASGDIDNDGLEDGVVSSTREDFVSVLLSAGDGSFRTGITFPVGRRLGDVTTLDFNRDGNLDIAAIEQRGGIMVAVGLGDGRFNPPVFLPGDRLGEGIQAGDLDNQNGPDIVTANGRSKNISIFINRGGNLGFLPSQEYGVGGNVKGDDIRIADFNTDGFNDIAVLNTRNLQADEISVLLNNTRAQFNTVTKFLVNTRAVAITEGDWNDDGITDLAALESGQLVVDQREFTMTILVNRTRIENGNVVGTAIFDQLRRIPISCPGDFNGAPIFCSVQDIEAGDFNGDGLADLAITIDTRLVQDIGLATPGLLQTFAGIGDGDFVFSTRVNVGLRPRGMAIGDTDGNLFDDIIVTQFIAPGSQTNQGEQDNNARIVRAIPPPPRPPGVPCREPKQCENGNCVDGVCCIDAFCPEGERCDIPGFEGECHPLGDLGDFCSIGEQCASGFCVDGFCCNAPQCPLGQFCNTGVCAGPAPPGSNCTENEQCNPPYCVDNTCCNMPACPIGERCDIPPFEGMCSAKLGIGEPCVEDGQCEDNLFCTNNVCCLSDECPAGQACDVPGREGICSSIPTPTPTPSRTPTPQGNGNPCTDPGQCLSGNCVNDTCCASAACPSNQRCDIAGSAGMCATPKPNQGDGCNKDSDCASGNCNFSAPNPPFLGSCGPPHTPTPVGPGGPCQTTSQCVPGFECNVEEGRICCEQLECPDGTSCRLPGKEGFCFALPTPTPTKLPNGVPCPNGSVCQSGNCVNDVCCQDAACVGDNRCDILGFAGRCVPPLPEGNECITNSDCAIPLECEVDDFGVRRCTVIDPTPTFIPTRTPTQSPQPTIIVDRDDGGCTIDSSQSGGVWVLALFPFFLGLRRYQRVAIRKE
jgi:hypothetical protein